jgi:hypothetical protein
MLQREETLKVLGAMAAAFPYAKIERPTIEIYAEALADIPPAVLKVAGLACISRSTFFPAIAELRTEALRAVAPDRPSPEAAWQQVLDQVRAVHYSGTPVFSDPIIAQVVAGVGWRDICLCEEPGVPRGQFYKLYAASCQRDQNAALLPQSVRDLTAKLRLPEQRQIGEGA